MDTNRSHKQSKQMKSQVLSKLNPKKQKQRIKSNLRTERNISAYPRLESKSHATSKQFGIMKALGLALPFTLMLALGGKVLFTEPQNVQQLRAAVKEQRAIHLTYKLGCSWENPKQVNFFRGVRILINTNAVDSQLIEKYWESKHPYTNPKRVDDGKNIVYFAQYFLHLASLFEEHDSISDVLKLVSLENTRNRRIDVKYSKKVQKVVNMFESMVMGGHEFNEQQKNKMAERLTKICDKMTSVLEQCKQEPLPDGYHHFIKMFFTKDDDPTKVFQIIKDKSLIFEIFGAGTKK